MQRHVLEQVGNAMDTLGQRIFSIILCILHYFYVYFSCTCPLLAVIYVLYLCIHLQMNIEKKNEGVRD